MSPKVSIPLSLFVGVLCGAVQADPNAFLSLATAKQALTTALFAALVAVVHYYQTPPTLAPAPIAAPAPPFTLTSSQGDALIKALSEALPAGSAIPEDLKFLIPKV